METRFMLRAEEAASEAAPCAPPPECAFPAVAGCTISLVQREVLVVFAVEVSEVSEVLSCKCFHNDDGSPRFADLYCLIAEEGERATASQRATARQGGRSIACCLLNERCRTTDMLRNPLPTVICLNSVCIICTSEESSIHRDQRNK